MSNISQSSVALLESGEASPPKIVARADKAESQATVPGVKLLHIVTVPISLHFFRGQIGYLLKHGFDVQAACSTGVEAEQARQREGILVHEVPMNRRLSPFADLVSLWRLIKLIRRLKPDVVHSHTPKAGLLGTIAARLCRVPGVMLTINGLPQMTKTGWQLRLLNAMTRISSRLAQRVSCDCNSIRQYLIDHRLCQAEKVVIMGNGSVNGVDSSQQFNPHLFNAADRADIRTRYGIPLEAQVVCFVGRIVADKGMRELAEAWLMLREKFPQLHLLLVGPFESEDPIRPVDLELFQTDPRIHLTGMRHDVPLHMAAVDVLVSPTYREGFNLTLIEAAAMELPVVATRIPGCIDSVADGVTGTLVPVYDSAAFAAAIERYLLDPALCQQHGTAGRERVVRDFQPVRIWQALKQHYWQLAGRKDNT
jgi:glycosyltransferase involved in cell wall biosynthesis